MTSKEEIVWLAGLLEGEGCFWLRKGYAQRDGYFRKPSPALKLAMADRDVVEHASLIMHSMTGVTTVFYSPDMRENFCGMYVSCCSGKNARKIMEAILPFMGDRRTTKIKELLDACPQR